MNSSSSIAGLCLVVMPDEQGRYHFDEMGYENLPEYLGYLIGAPLRPACLACPRRSRALPERASPTRMRS
jgi:hypothetical protein